MTRLALSIGTKPAVYRTLILLGLFTGLTGRPLSGSTIAAVLLIIGGGALAVRSRRWVA